jgi:hypothetical protein
MTPAWHREFRALFHWISPRCKIAMPHIIAGPNVVEYLFGRNATGAFYLRAPRQVYRVFAMRARHEAG